MSGNTLSARSYLSQVVDDDSSFSVKILAVGEPDDWVSSGNSLPRGDLAFVSFFDVTEEMLDHLDPEVIYSPVLARSFDCIELAMLLHNLGFDGVYNAYARDLPKPALIEREVKQICPRLDFRIVTENT